MSDTAKTGLAARNAVSSEAALDFARAQTQGDGLIALAHVAQPAWQALADRSIEPNGYYLPDWARAVSASARGRRDGQALAVWGDKPARALIGLMPVVTAYQAYRLPLPALVSFDAYGALGTPLLDAAVADEAAGRLMERAREVGAHALILRDTPLHGPAMTAFARVLGWSGLRPVILNAHERALLDATRGADELLHNALGAKKLKELRRLRNRLAEHGAVAFQVASGPADVEAACEHFLALEASGWKGRRGTALASDTGDATFLRTATAALAARGQCEIIQLSAGDTAVAAGVVLRHGDRAFFFKLGIDERFARFSPGVQLTLDLTRHLCADPAIASADSTAIPRHPMIDPLWRGRLAVGDVLIPLKGRDPIVAAIEATLRARRLARHSLRPLVHLVRRLRSQNP